MTERKDVEKQLTWDLSAYAESNQDCLQKLQKVLAKIPEFQKYKGKLNTKEAIFDCLQKLSAFNQQLSKLAVYAHCKVSEDSTNDDNLVLEAKVDNVYDQLSLATSFIEVEISALDDEFLVQLQNDTTHTQFSNYFKDLIRQKKHILSEKEEELLSQIGGFTGGFRDVFSIFDSSDIRFEPAVDQNGNKIPLTYANYIECITSKDAKLRESGYKNLNGAFKTLENTLAVNYANQVKMLSTLVKIRKYDSVLECALDGDELSKDFYDVLLKKVKQNSGIMQRYFKTKQNILGLKKMTICDVAVDVGTPKAQKISYDESFELLKKALAPLGKEYVGLLDTARKDRWVDACINKGKRSGAFQTESYGANPLVCMQYNGDINSVSTLAHELGHAMHSYYSSKNQPFEKANYPIFLAEIASTVNENFLNMYLLSKAQNKDEKIYYYNQFLETVRATIFRQVHFAEFEKSVFEKYDQDKAVTKKFFQETYVDLTKKYYGSQVELVDETRFEYSRISHFYRAFYVFKYATGLLSAILIVKKFMDNEPNIKQNYIKFLSSGDSLPPLETLKLVGVDLTDEKTYDEAFEFIEKMQKDFEVLTQKKTCEKTCEN